MAELWNDYWWAIVLIALIAAGGGIGWSRSGKAHKAADRSADSGGLVSPAGGRSQKKPDDLEDAGDAGSAGDGGGGAD